MKSLVGEPLGNDDCLIHVFLGKFEESLGKSWGSLGEPWGITGDER